MTAPPAPTPGAWKTSGEIAGEVFRGSLRGLGELAVEMAKGTVLNIATAGLYGGYGLAAGIWHGYQEEGVLGAVNVLNPLYGLGRLGADASMAAENGDYEDAAAAGVKVVVLTAAAVLGGIEEGAAIEGGEAGGAANRGGKAFTGVAYELKHIPKHIEGTAAAEKLIAREGAAHVFPNMETLVRVENAIFKDGQFTGTITRGSTVTARFGLMFESPIGYRVAADRSRIPLYYGEAKVNAIGLYHVMPRTGPAR